MPFIFHESLPFNQKQYILQLLENRIQPTQDIHVLSSFSNNDFNNLYKIKDCFIISDSLLINSLKENISIPFFSNERKAIYSCILTGIVVTTSHISLKQRDNIFKKVIFMGGRVSNDYTSSITHLITNTINTPKYNLALKRNDTIVLPLWIEDCWKEGKLLPEIKYSINNKQENIEKHKEEEEQQIIQIDEHPKTNINDIIIDNKDDSIPINTNNNKENINIGPLSSCIISVSGYSAKQRHTIIELVKFLGGIYSVPLSTKVTHFLCENPTRKKYLQARKLNIPFCISGKWLEDCVKQKIRVNESSYILCKPDDIYSDDISSFTCYKSIEARFDKVIHSAGKLFTGIYFLAIGFDVDEVHDLNELISSYGGTLLSNAKLITPGCTFNLSPHGYKNTNNNNNIIYTVTPNWLERCIEEGKLLDPRLHVLFSPLPCTIPLNECKGKIISISGIKSKERRSLRMLVIILGFKYYEKLTPTVDYLLTNSEINENTLKLDKAQKWNIPLIHSNWIIKSAKIGKLLPVQQYYIISELPKPILPTINNENNYNNITEKQHISYSSPKSQEIIRDFSKTPILLGVIIFTTSRISQNEKEKIELLCSQLGATIHLKLSSSVTHIIDNLSKDIDISPSSLHNYSSIQSPSKIKSTYPSVKFVSIAWLEEVKKQKKWIDESLFPPIINNNMKLGLKISQHNNIAFKQNNTNTNNKNNNINTTGSKRLRPLDFNVESYLVGKSPPRKKQKLCNISSKSLFLQHNQEQEGFIEEISNNDNTYDSTNNNSETTNIQYFESGTMEDDIMNAIDILDPPSPSKDKLNTIKQNNNITQSNTIFDKSQVIDNDDTQEDNNIDINLTPSTEEDIIMIDYNKLEQEHIINNENNMEKLAKEETKRLIEQVENKAKELEKLEKEKQEYLNKIKEDEKKKKKDENNAVLYKLEELLKKSKDETSSSSGFISLIPENNKKSNNISLQNIKKTTLQSHISEDNDNNNNNNTDELYCSESEDSIDSQVVFYKDCCSSSNIISDSQDLSVEAICQQFTDTKPCKYFTFSGLDVQKKQELKNIILKLGGFVVDNIEECTHLIVKAKSKSLKYLSALAGGKWILKPEYIIESYNNNIWIQEENYEWEFIESSSSSPSSNISPPSYWREKIQKNEINKPFYGMKIGVFISNYEKDIAQVLNIGGGKVLFQSQKHSEEYLESIMLRLSLIIMDDNLIKPNSKHLSYLKQFHRRHIRCIGTKYIVDYLYKNPDSCNMDKYTLTLVKKNNKNKK